MAVLLSVGSDVGPHASAVARDAVRPVAVDTGCCMEIVALPAVFAEQPVGGVGESASASRMRVVDRFLPAGDAPESGLQVKTILAARSISAIFPEIQQIGGVRPDSLRWHPDGLALDVMIPNHGTAEGIALGDQIVAFVFKNAERFAVQDAIWRGVYYTPGGARRGGYGHYDHVHITTFGGGYPTGGELYPR